MQLLDDAFPVFPFIMVRPRIMVVHAIPHCVVKQDGDLASCCRYGLCIADAARKTTIKRAQCCIGPADRDRCQSKRHGDPAAGLTRVRRQNLAAADFATGRQGKPGRKMFSRRPTPQVGTAFADQS